MAEGPGLPRSARYVVIGAGIHGLSTAWHLARMLRLRGNRSVHSTDVLVLDKSDIGAGASGIACGVIRNNYRQPAMRRLMAHSVSVWESDPAAFAYHPVGYLQAAPEVMRADVEQIYAEQRDIGYPSTLVEGEHACRGYLNDLFGDWQAPGVTTVLHEFRGGYANNQTSIRGLAAKAADEGVCVHTGVTVTGFELSNGAVHTVQTSRGPIQCEQVIIAVGPWVRDLWAMLGLPASITFGGETVDMWRYLQLQEGTLGVDPATFTDRQGAAPPVVHVDSDAPLYDENQKLVTDEMWGIYYKPDFSFDGVQGGSTPLDVGKPAAEVAVDPYGPASPEFTVPAEFPRMFTSALAHCHRRFQGSSHLYKHQRSGGLGCFTPDSFPVFDMFCDNAYVIADSNHGYKMIGVGDLVAREVLGEPQEMLDPFRFDRYRRGAAHPVSSSPFPWS